MKATDILTPDVLLAAGWCCQPATRHPHEFCKRDDEEVFSIYFHRFKIIVDFPEFHVKLPKDITVEKFDQLLDIVNLPQFKITK